MAKIASDIHNGVTKLEDKKISDHWREYIEEIPVVEIQVTHSLQSKKYRHRKKSMEEKEKHLQLLISERDKYSKIISDNTKHLSRAGFIVQADLERIVHTDIALAEEMKILSKRLDSTHEKADLDTIQEEFKEIKIKHSFATEDLIFCVNRYINSLDTISLALKDGYRSMINTMLDIFAHETDLTADKLQTIINSLDGISVDISSLSKTFNQFTVDACTYLEAKKDPRLDQLIINLRKSTDNLIESNISIAKYSQEAITICKRDLAQG